MLPRPFDGRTRVRLAIREGGTMQQTAPRPSLAAGALATLGGILTLVSSFLVWGRVVATNGSGDHIDIKGGSIVLITGIVIVVFGVLLVAVRALGVRRVIAILVLLGGLGGILVGGIWASSKKVALDTIADKEADIHSVSHASAERSFENAEKQGVIKVSTQVAPFLALGGGVLALIGGIGGLRRGKR